jgi:hypothetical protein
MPGCSSRARIRASFTSSDGRSTIGLSRVGREPVEARAQKGTEPRLGRVEAREEILLEGAQEESLRQVGRVLRRRVPFEAHVLEDRLPVRRHERVEGVQALVGPRAPHRGHDGMAGRRKCGHGQG